jgi:D-psicose/D-tagatose/L-ribulose 3-epimerase
MRLGVNTLIWTAHFEAQHLDLFPAIKAHGFAGVEVARFNFQDFPASTIRSRAKEEGLELLLCSAFTGDLSLADESALVRQRAKDHLLSALEAAVAIGSSIVVGPFCTPVGGLPGCRRTADEWKRVVEGLASVAPRFEQANVQLALEPLNRFETYFLNTTADAVDLCTQVNSSHVGILFDTFHANIEERNVPAALGSAGGKVFHVHTCENDRGAPGSGHIDWHGVASQLKAMDYQGWCVIESFGFNIKEIAAAACIWRDLAPTPEDIAWNGAAFLKPLLD